MSNNLTYFRCDDYYIPALALHATEQKPLGKYGRMRKKYLQEHRPVLWNLMILSERLYTHLREIDEAASARLAQIMDEMIRSERVDEKLKAVDQMAWVGAMNSIQSRAEEIVLHELVWEDAV